MIVGLRFRGNSYDVEIPRRPACILVSDVSPRRYSDSVPVLFKGFPRLHTVGRNQVDVRSVGDLMHRSCDGLADCGRSDRAGVSLSRSDGPDSNPGEDLTYDRICVVRFVFVLFSSAAAALFHL
jgi:hypothetical protein